MVIGLVEEWRITARVERALCVTRAGFPISVHLRADRTDPSVAGTTRCGVPRPENVGAERRETGKIAPRLAEVLRLVEWDYPITGYVGRLKTDASVAGVPGDR